MLAATFTLPYVVAVAIASGQAAPVEPKHTGQGSAALLVPWLFQGRREYRAQSRMPGPTDIETDAERPTYDIWTPWPSHQVEYIFWRGTLDYGSHLERAESSDLLSTETKKMGDSWSALGLRTNDIRLSHSHEMEILWAKLNAKTVVIDPNAAATVPVRRSGWQTEESVRLPLVGSLFVVGQVGANSGSIEWQQYKLIGKTGLGWKLPSWLGGEVQLRGGRSVANYDSDTDAMFPEQMKRFFEFNTRWPLADWLNVEYTGQTSSTMLPASHETLTHEFRLAFPLSNSGEFHIGAKYRAEDASTPSLWYERTKLLIGLELKR